MKGGGRRGEWHSSVHTLVLFGWAAQTIELAPAATRGHRSAASLATGPVMAEPAAGGGAVSTRSTHSQGARAQHSKARRAEPSAERCV